MSPECIGGAYYQSAVPSTWHCSVSATSEDNRRLVRVYQVPHDNLRVLRFIRVPGAPQFIGEWWSEVGSSIVESTVEANQLAQDFLHLLDGDNHWTCK
jgi:hypothetical protein